MVLKRTKLKKLRIKNLNKKQNMLNLNRSFLLPPPSKLKKMINNLTIEYILVAENLVCKIKYL